MADTPEWNGRVTPEMSLSDPGLGTEEVPWPESVVNRSSYLVQATRILAHGAIAAGRVVSYVGEAVSVASQPTLLSSDSVAGVALNGCADGQLCLVAVLGIVEDAGASWTAGGILYLVGDGELSHTPPTSGVVVKIGYALSATKMIVTVRESFASVNHTHTLASITGAGTAASRDVGTGDANVVLGNDARLTDARTPLDHNHSIAGVSGLTEALSTIDQNFTGIAEDFAALGDAAYKDVGTGADNVAAGNHSHAIAKVDGLQDALDAKANLNSPTLTGTPNAPTAEAGTNNTQIATTAFAKAAAEAAAAGKQNIIMPIVEFNNSTGTLVAGVECLITYAGAGTYTMPEMVDGGFLVLRPLTAGHTINYDGVRSFWKTDGSTETTITIATDELGAVTLSAFGGVYVGGRV